MIDDRLANSVDEIRPQQALNAAVDVGHEIDDDIFRDAAGAESIVCPNIEGLDGPMSFQSVKGQIAEHAAKYRPSSSRLRKNHLQNAFGNIFWRMDCPIHIPIQPDANATMLARPIET